MSQTNRALHEHMHMQKEQAVYKVRWATPGPVLRAILWHMHICDFIQKFLNLKDR